MRLINTSRPAPLLHPLCPPPQVVNTMRDLLHLNPLYGEQFRTLLSLSEWGLGGACVREWGLGVA